MEGVSAAPRRSLPTALIYRAAGGGSALCQQIIVPAVAPVIHQPAVRFQSAGPLSLRNYRSTRQSRREIIVCSLLSPGKFKEKMRFRLLALDHGVFFPAVLILKSPTPPIQLPNKRRELPAALQPVPPGRGAQPVGRLAAGTAQLCSGKGFDEPKGEISTPLWTKHWRRCPHRGGFAAPHDFKPEFK